MSHKEHSFMPLLMNNAEKENRAEKERGDRNCRNFNTLIKFFQIKIASTNIPKCHASQCISRN